MPPITPRTKVSRPAIAWLAPVLATALALAAGCAPSYVDTDGTAQTAAELPTDYTQRDALDFDQGDRLDWKSVAVTDTGKATLAVVVGDPFARKQDLTGVIGVFPTSGPPAVAQVDVVPGEFEYNLSWDTDGPATYLVRFEATKGKAAYRSDFAVAYAPKDPCEGISCAEGEACQAGACVRVAPLDPTVCEPTCDDDSTCIDNVCEPYCGGPCKRGYYCHHKRNECLKDPCYGKRCGAGKRCVWGRCKAVGGSDPKEEEQPADEEVETSPTSLTGRIIQTIDTGKTVTLVINKGKTHGVEVGMSGSIPGFGTATIREVYAFRSKAVMPGSAKDLKGKRTIVFALK